MSKITRLGPQSLLQLRIELEHSHPLIWRTVLVPDTVTLVKLHEVIQVAMGWQDYHLHEYIMGNLHFGPVDPESDPAWDLAPEMINEQRKRLKNVLGHERQFKYIYDYGDNWCHAITVEKVIPLEDSMPITTCTGGEMACPPEDVGGIGGYCEFLEALADPRHEMHEDMMRWWGELFDPKYFDISDTNQRLRHLKI